MPHCTNCGQEIRDEAVACGYCGSRVTPTRPDRAPGAVPPAPWPGSTPVFPEPSVADPTRSNAARRSSRASKALILCALVLVVAVAVLGSTLVGTQASLARERDTADSFLASSERWKSELEGAEQSSRQYDQQLQELQKRVKTSVGSLDHPRFKLWNSCGGGPGDGCSLVAGHEYVGGVPDTFTYDVRFRSTVPVTVWIMSTSNFVCWETRLCAWRAAVGWQNRTSLKGAIFHSAEGCAGYLAVFTSSRAGTLYPDVRVTRHPAPHPTGVCA
jgi:hypothetical protein